MNNNITSAPRAATLRASLALAFTCLTCFAGNAAAAESASATMASTQLSPTSWQYSLTLNDTGTTNLGTFWFAWVPGQNFMPTRPTDIVSPAAWNATITNAGAADGFAIEWVAGAGAGITPGQSTTFSFASATTPTQMMADSPFHPASPVLTTFVYSGGPFSDPGYQFVVQAAPVPEPASIALMVAGGLVVSRIVRRRSRSVDKA